MSICHVSGKTVIALFSVHHPATVQVHLGDGKGSKNTTTQSLKATSTILKSSLSQYLELKVRISIYHVSAKICAALFSAHHPSSVQVHLGDGRGS